jgi:hypothetical protein
MADHSAHDRLAHSSGHLVIDLNIHLPQGQGSDLSAKLDGVVAQIHALTLQGKTIMSTVTSVKQLVTDLDTETNDVAAKVDAQTAEIKRLSDVIAAGGTITQADLDAISDGLTPISERLKVLGASQTDPIPPVEG